MSDPTRIRIQNVSGKAHCEWCDDGLAVTARRGEMAEYGPCPWCEKGFRLEFPTGEQTKAGFRPAEASWGQDGYWQGRPLVVERAPDHRMRYLPLGENAARMRLLMARHAGADVDPCVGLDIERAAERMARVIAEAALLP